MKNFAEKARPLHALYEKKAKFLWTPECQTAFDSLKNAMISSPILGLVLPICSLSWILMPVIKLLEQFCPKVKMVWRKS